MQITTAGFVLLPIIGLITALRPRWLVPTMVLLAPLASTSVVNISAITFGVQAPAAAAIALILVTLPRYAQLGAWMIERAGMRHLLPLGVLAGWAFISGQLMPRLFSGTRVLNADGDFVSLAASRLHITQFGYLLFGVLIAAAVLSELRSADAHDAFIGALVGSGWVAFLLGLVQLREANSPTWASDVLFSNPGFLLLIGQRVGGAVRLSSTLIEPSVAAVFFGGYLAAMWMLWSAGARIRTPRPVIVASFVMALVALFLTRATTAVVALAVVLGLVVWRTARSRQSTEWLAIALVSTVAVVVGAIALSRTGLVNEGGVFGTISELTVEKSDSNSADERLAGEQLAWDGFSTSYGLGLGWGSVRAFSLASTVMANLGIPGVLLILWFLVRTRRLARSAKSSGVYSPLASAAGTFAAAAFTTAAFSSPDVTFVFLWAPVGAWIAGMLPVHSKPVQAIAEPVVSVGETRPASRRIAGYRRSRSTSPPENALDPTTESARANTRLGFSHDTKR